ncbi:hypothetical protein F3Y22_tig00112926pilonHSYRG00008 [Hibiscus syriacus]|uniref:BHLH domain-containing protein n=1 Tax=Hibiscus syriacus TaxID=106335 RepID=A0A6A2Y4N4_HIBSY|nr:hypothetical protein F3Y22_tig00112926pilonHSYRG00008 [Hibiscus syriacus]
MRLLLSTLVSVLPPRPKKMPMPQVVENATVYVKQLQELNLIATTTSALCDIITILEEEGAEVVSVNYHKDGNRIRLSVHSQAAYSRIGIENLRVRERLKRLQIS